MKIYIYIYIYINKKQAKELEIKKEKLHPLRRIIHLRRDFNKEIYDTAPSYDLPQGTTDQILESVSG